MNSDNMLRELSTFVFSIENTADDMNLLALAIERLKNINAHENLHKASIGTMLMKTLHYFQNDDLAQKVIFAFHFCSI